MFNACNKEKNVPDTYNDKERILTNDQIEEIGLKHNIYLTDMLNSNELLLLEKGVNNHTYSKKNFQEICSNLNVPELSNQDKILLTSNTYNISYLEKNIKNKLVLDIIHEAIIESEKISDYNVLHNKIIELNESSTKILYGIDLDIALVFLEVLDNSAQFWLSKSANGSGKGESILNQISSSRSSSGKSSLGILAIEEGPGKGSKLLAADATGAAGVFVSYGLLAGVTGPMGIGALATTVAFGAAWSSGAAALGI